MLNRFASQKFVDHEIWDGGGKYLGTIRVKPSGILWKRKNAHKWKQATLDEFAAFMEKDGRDSKH